MRFRDQEDCARSNVSMSRETLRRPGFSPYGSSQAALESKTAILATAPASPTND